MLAWGIHGRQEVVLVGRLDLLVGVNAVVFPIGQVAMPPTVISAKHPRLDPLCDQGPETIRAIVIEDFNLVAILYPADGRIEVLDGRLHLALG